MNGFGCSAQLIDKIKDVLALASGIGGTDDFGCAGI